MKPVRIGYHRLWAPAMLVIAAINIALFVTAGGLLQACLAVLFLLFGILYATRPLLLVDDQAVTAKSLIGYTVKRVPHGSFENLQVDDGSIVLGPENHRQRMTLSRWMVSRKDLERLAEAVRAARASPG